MFDYLLVADSFLLNMAELAGIALFTRLSGYQPQYFPRLHYFARMLDSDIFTITDYLQYVRKHAFIKKDGTKSNSVSYQAHTPVKTHQEVQTLGIPVIHVQQQSIRDAKIDYATPWHIKHLNIIRDSYGRAPYFGERYGELEALLLQKYDTLGELSIASVGWALSVLFTLPVKSTQENFDSLSQILPQEPFRLKKLVLLNETQVPPPDKAASRDANDWLVDQCRVFGANEYYFGGTSALAYMDLGRFEKAGIGLTEQQWLCPPYPQLHGTFVCNLSIIDLLMNVSPTEARRVLYTK